MVPQPRQQGRAGRTARAVVSRRVCAARGLRWRSAMACSFGRGFWRTWRRAVCSRDTRQPTRATIARIRRRGDRFCRDRSFLTTTSLIATRGCHNRCGFCYLATDGLRMPYRMRDPDQVAAEFAGGRAALRRLHRQQSGIEPRSTCARLCRALRPLNKIWSAAVSIDVTDDPSLVRAMALRRMYGRLRGIRVAHRRESRRCQEENAEDRRLCAPGPACCTTTASR